MIAAATGGCGGPDEQVTRTVDERGVAQFLARARRFDEFAIYWLGPRDGPYPLETDDDPIELHQRGPYPLTVRYGRTCSLPSGDESGTCNWAVEIEQGKRCELHTDLRAHPLRTRIAGLPAILADNAIYLYARRTTIRLRDTSYQEARRLVVRLRQVSGGPGHGHRPRAARVRFVRGRPSDC